MDKEAKRKLINAYKEQSLTQAGGIYLIENKKNGKIFLGVTADVAAIKNRFASAKLMGGSFHPKMNADWAAFGGSAFELDIAETINKNESQTPAEFAADLDLLKKMWLEKFDTASLY